MWPLKTRGYNLEIEILTWKERVVHIGRSGVDVLGERGGGRYLLRTEMQRKIDLVEREKKNTLKQHRVRQHRHNSGCETLRKHSIHQSFNESLE